MRARAIGLAGTAAGVAAIAAFLTPAAPTGGAVVRGDQDVKTVVVSRDGHRLHVGYVTVDGRGDEFAPGNECVPGAKVSVQEHHDRVEIDVRRWFREDRPHRLPRWPETTNRCGMHWDVVKEMTVSLDRPLGSRSVVANGKRRWVFQPPDPLPRQLPGGYDCGRGMEVVRPALFCRRGAGHLAISWSDPREEGAFPVREQRRIGGLDVDVVDHPYWTLRWLTPRGLVEVQGDASAQETDLAAAVAAVDAASQIPSSDTPA